MKSATILYSTPATPEYIALMILQMNIPARKVAAVAGNLLIRAHVQHSQTLSLIANYWWEAGLVVYGEEMLVNQ